MILIDPSIPFLFFFRLAVFLFSNDPRKYRVCTLFNVCVSSKAVFLVLEDDGIRAEYSELIAQCDDKFQKPVFCRCFPKDKPRVLVKSLEELGRPYHVAQGHTWVADRLLQGQQDQNWAEVMTFFHSMSMKPEDYRSNPLLISTSKQTNNTK